MQGESAIPIVPSADDAAEARYRALLDASLSPICRHDGQVVHYVNPAGVRALGMSSPGQVVGRPIADFVDPATLTAVRSGLESLNADGDVSAPVEVTMRRIDGTTISMPAVSTLRVDAGGRFYEVVCAPHISTPRQNVRIDAASDTTAPSGARPDDRLYAVLDMLHVGIMISSNDGRVQFVNEAARRIIGAGAGELVGLHHRDQGLNLAMFDAKGERIGAHSHPMNWIIKTGMGIMGEVIGVDRADGRRVWVTGNGCLLDPQNPATSPVLMSFTDITEHYDARERLRHEANHDWLTGLPNRVHALDQAAAALVATGADRLAAVLFLDLNGMKAVNDSYGHPVGDDVLRIAAQRMRATLRTQDLVARIGGDEFLVLVRGPYSVEDLETIVARLYEALAAEMQIGTRRLQIGVSVGATLVAENDRRNLAQVLHDADVDMYRAKAESRCRTGALSDN